MNSLLVCIQHEIAAMADLTQVLRDEQNLLTLAPTLQVTQDIAINTRRKNQYIAEISRRSQERRQVLSNDGITEPDSIHPNWLHTPEQQQHWDVLIQATQQAKELNRVNSLLVTRHMARNQATLAVLYRHNLNGNGSGMYGPNGQATGSRPRIPSYAAK